MRQGRTVAELGRTSRPPHISLSTNPKEDSLLPTPPLSRETHRRIRELHSQGFTQSAICSALGVSAGTVSRYRLKPLGDEPTLKLPPETSEMAGDKWTISLPRTPIHTLAELAEHCKIDLTIWEVERWVCNKWEVGTKDDAGNVTVTPLFQIKAFLKKNKAAVIARDLAEEFRQKAERYSPKKFPAVIHRNPSSGVMAEFSIFDHHFGAHIWGKETGGADYDLAIAERCYKDAVSALVARMRGYKPELAVLVVGNDQQNADNRQGLTEKGTPQDMDTRYQKVTDLSYDCTQWAVDVLLGEFGKVKVVVAPGNHDPLTSWHLGKYLVAWYRHCPAVTVDNSPAFRKYLQWGSTMLMWTHGNTGKLEDYDRTMAAERPDMWGATTWREAHTADKHQRRLIELKGATVRILPSLRPPDAWSSDNHHIGSTRAAESYAWDKKEALIGTACFSIPPR